MKKIYLLWAGAALVALLSACQNPADGNGGSKARDVAGGVPYVLPYSPYNYKVLESKFTGNVVSVDGDLNEEAWSSAPPSSISNYKEPLTAVDAASGAMGTIKSLWDGYTLYIAVDVDDNTPAKWSRLEDGDDSITQQSNDAYGSSGNPSGGWGNDGNWNHYYDNVEFLIDFWNDKQDKWADDDGIFAISRSGKLTYRNGEGYPSDEGTYASVFASPLAREYNDRIKAYAVTEKASGAGYTVELALQIYGAKPANGTGFGVDVMISDSPQDDTMRTSRTYWSHSDNTYRFNSRDGNLDWGCIVLTGHTAAGTDDFAKSEWMLTNAIRWVDRNLPGTQDYAGSAQSVADNWSEPTWLLLSNAVKAGRDLDRSAATQTEIKTKAQAIEAAIAGLVAADDPLGATAMTYPPTNTLSDPLVFKTALTGGTPGATVQNAADWAKRAEEIRQLASIYEYGPKPGTPTVTVTTVTGVPGFREHWEPAPWYYPNKPPSLVSSSPGSYTFTATVAYTGTEASVPAGIFPQEGSQNISFNLYKPGRNGKAPVILNFDGMQSEFVNEGVAVLAIPSSVTTDDRATPWQSGRAGIFRSFYPYNARGQRYEMSNEMGAAWGASRAIDALIAAKDIGITTKSFSITIVNNATTEATFTLKDRITFDTDTRPPGWEMYLPDTRTWWQVGKLQGAETVAVQGGAGKAVMLYLASGSPAPSQAAGSYSLTSLTIQHQNDQGVWETVSNRGTVEVTLTVDAETVTNEKLGDFIDETQLAVTGYSINGKYAFVSALYDDRIKVAIPGAAGATGPQAWRYNPAGTVYSAGKGNLAGGELIGDNVMKNPGRATEIFRRFLTHFNYYERLRGIDAKGDFSYGYAQRLPYDGHELVAAMFPRAVIERAVMNDFNDGSEQDAISFQAARLVYRKLIDLGGAVATPGGVTIDKPGIDNLVVFNYHKWASSGDPHGAVSTHQRINEALYMGWYFNGGAQPTYLTADEIFPWNTDPFFIDVLVTNGSNSYERHYGGFSVMMPWPWAGSYYPSR